MLKIFLNVACQKAPRSWVDRRLHCYTVFRYIHGRMTDCGGVPYRVSSHSIWQGHCYYCGVHGNPPTSQWLSSGGEKIHYPEHWTRRANARKQWKLKYGVHKLKDHKKRTKNYSSIWSADSSFVLPVGEDQYLHKRTISKSQPHRIRLHLRNKFYWKLGHSRAKQLQ